MSFSILEQTILKAKGITAEQLDQLAAAGVSAKGDFATIGDAETLMDVLPGLDEATAEKVMEWATGAARAAVAAAPAPAEPAKMIIDSADAIYCLHCSARQPKDYKTGDLCTTCGKQAEPVQSCFWCSSSGPGKFCRSCGAEFVPLAEYEIALLLKREGVAKADIAGRLHAMDRSEKDVLWSRARRMNG
jgi:hypothetical protein